MDPVNFLDDTTKNQVSEEVVIDGIVASQGRSRE